MERMSEVEDPALDSLFRCLADGRRRIVLAHLLDGGDRSATVDELADAVIETEGRSPSSDPESVAITLDHVHLPLLADAGFIDYERDRGVVTPTDRTTSVEPHLNAVRDGHRVDAIGREETGDDGVKTSLRRDRDRSADERRTGGDDS
jgi:DNA-binding transcriptional ArsR family regulator